MSAVFFSEPVLTEIDYVRLSALNRRQPSAELASVLDEAEVVPNRMIPGTVATMYSRLWVRDNFSGIERMVILCYPQDANLDNGYLSVLSPVGAKLLGRSAGHTVTWTGPDAVERSMTIDSVMFQPESGEDLKA